MNAWLFCVLTSIFVLVWFIVSLVFPFLWCMVYELIHDEMYVVCSEFDVSGVTLWLEGL